MVEVLERRFLNLSRPLRILRVAETRVVVWGAEVVLGWDTLLRLKRDLLPNNFRRGPPGGSVGEDCWLSGFVSKFSDSDLYYRYIVCGVIISEK
jgi:hypothetical protein